MKHFADDVQLYSFLLVTRMTYMQGRNFTPKRDMIMIMITEHSDLQLALTSPVQAKL